MLSLLNPHRRDGHISFKAEGHVYTVDGDQEYSSVTTWLHSHFKPFDTEKVLDRIFGGQGPRPGTKYHGKTRDQVKAEWDQNRDAAAQAGTALHDEIDRYYNGMGPGLPAARTQPDFALFENFRRAHMHLKPYRTEWMVWDQGLRLAGSIDMVFEREEAPGDGRNRVVDIYDWKRCKDIRKSSPWNEFAPSACIGHLPDTNYWHYALQLNVYAALLERNYEVEVGELWLVCLHPRQATYKKLRVPRLSTEMAALLSQRAIDVARG